MAARGITLRIADGPARRNAAGFTRHLVQIQKGIGPVSNSVLLERRTDLRYDHGSPVEDLHTCKLPKPDKGVSR